MLDTVLSYINHTYFEFFRGLMVRTMSMEFEVSYSMARAALCEEAVTLVFT